MKYNEKQNTIQVNENESHCTKQLLTAIATNDALNQRQVAFLTCRKIAKFVESEFSNKGQRLEPKTVKNRN